MSNDARAQLDSDAVRGWQLPELGREKIAWLADSPEAELARYPQLKSAVATTADNEQPEAAAVIRKRVSMQELQELLAEARQKGFDEGFASGQQRGEENGLANGMRQAESRLESALATMERVNEQLPEALNLHNQAEQQLLLILIERLVRCIVGVEVERGEIDTQHFVEQLLEQRPAHDQVLEVRVSPQDFECLEPFCRNFGWRLTADPAMQHGDCALQSKHAALDYSVDSRLDDALAALRSRLLRATQA